MISAAGAKHEIDPRLVLAGSEDERGLDGRRAIRLRHREDLVTGGEQLVDRVSAVIVRLDAARIADVLRGQVRRGRVDAHACVRDRGVMLVGDGPCDRRARRRMRIGPAVDGETRPVAGPWGAGGGVASAVVRRASPVPHQDREHHESDRRKYNAAEQLHGPDGTPDPFRERMRTNCSHGTRADTPSREIAQLRAARHAIPSHYYISQMRGLVASPP